MLNTTTAESTPMKTPIDNYTLATAPELARICKVSRRTIDNWQKQRRIPVIKVGASVRFNVADVMAALSKFTVTAIK